VGLVRAYFLNDLPTEKQFLNDLADDDEEYED
jgi:hypothetical protein